MQSAVAEDRMTDDTRQEMEGLLQRIDAGAGHQGRQIQPAGVGKIAALAPGVAAHPGGQQKSDLGGLNVPFFYASTA